MLSETERGFEWQILFYGYNHQLIMNESRRQICQIQENREKRARKLIYSLTAVKWKRDAKQPIWNYMIETLMTQMRDTSLDHWLLM
jgi:hypothetical protein